MTFTASHSDSPYVSKTKTSDDTCLHVFSLLHFLTFWAKLSRIGQEPQYFFSIQKILSNFWAILSYCWAIFSYFWAILSYFWAKLSRICRGSPILFLVLRAILSKIEQDMPGPTNTFFSIASNFEQNCAGFAGAHQCFFFVLGAFLSKLVKGQLGVPPTVYPWYLLCSLRILADYNP